MAFEIGVTTDYLDLLSKLKTFVTKANIVSAATPYSGNVGNGDVSSISVDNAAPTETWVLTCLAAGSGGTFSVVGSVSGAQANAVFDVAYDNGIVAFTIDEGSASFSVGDEFEFTVEMILGEEVWEVQRWDTDVDGTGEYELILKGPGTGGTDEIFVGIQSYSSAGNDYYNWRLNGFTGFSALLDFLSQPGAMQESTTERNPSILLHDTAMDYWFVVNGRRIIVVANVSSGASYESCYLGFLLSYGLPNQIPYPLAIGGTSPAKDSDQMRYSSIDPYHRGFMDSAGEYDQDLATLSVLHSGWHGVSNWYGDVSPDIDGINVWPYIMSDYKDSTYPANYEWIRMKENIDGSYPLWPCVVIGDRLNDEYYRSFFGELQGVFAVPGIGLATEDVVSVGGIEYIVFKNCHRTARENFFALKME